MAKNNIKPAVLVILDGFGFSTKTMGNAVFNARMPTLQRLMGLYPWIRLQAAQEAVGLLPGYAGNSEVGHLTIGAGKIVPSPLKRMHDLIEQDGLVHHQQWQMFLKQVARSKKRLHFLGLLSSGGVHSHERHLHALLKSAHQAGVQELVVHAWLDGRDVAPRSAGQYLQRLDLICQELGNVSIASLSGRLYAMDRDKNYDRTDQVVEVITKKRSFDNKAWQDYLLDAYEQGFDDQYVKPVLLDTQGVIDSEDALFFFNIRPERTKQIVERLCDPQQGGLLCNHIMSSVAYWESMPSWAPVALLDRVIVDNGLLQSINRHAEQEHFRIITVAESEKRVHVGYYLHGNNSQVCTHEKQVIIPSLKLDSYAENPAMSASLITDEVVKRIKEEAVGFIVVNYANADMVAHSGDFEATVKACEFLDGQLAILTQEIEQRDGTLIITADHGNAEEMIDEETGEKRTSHTTSDVIFLMASSRLQGAQFERKSAGLSVIAPTILSYLGYEHDNDMVEPLMLSKKRYFLEA